MLSFFYFFYPKGKFVAFLHSRGRLADSPQPACKHEEGSLIGSRLPVRLLSKMSAFRWKLGKERLGVEEVISVQCSGHWGLLSFLKVIHTEGVLVGNGSVSKNKQIKTCQTFFTIQHIGITKANENKHTHKHAHKQTFHGTLILQREAPCLFWWHWLFLCSKIQVLA